MTITDVFKLAKGKNAQRMKLSILYKVLEITCSAVLYGVIYLTLRMLFSDKPWDYSDIMMLTGVTAIALGGQFFFGVLGARAAFASGYAMMCDFRLDLVEHLSRLPLGFFQNKRVGVLTSTVAENVKNIEDIFTRVLGDFVACFTLPLFVGLILLVIDWRMGIAAMASVPIAFAVLKLSQGYFSTLSSGRIHSQAEASGRILEYIDGIRVIRSFGLAGEKFAALEKSLDEQRKLSIKLEINGGLTFVLFAMVLELSFIGLLIVGAYGILGGHISATTYLMGMILAQKFFAPLTRAALLLVDLKYLELALKPINVILSQPQLPEPKFSKKPKHSGVNLNQVTFRYDENDKEPALKSVSMELKQGQTTALVGPSGAGKSTLIHLIARFHDLTEGNILIGDIDIRDLSFDDLMEQVSMVLQDVYLFNDTVAANLRLGAPDATDEEIMEAARNAQCHDFIMKLPQKYQTPVGEGGAWLSGGQKQRLSIARALLKNAPIILLDESTASVDPQNELAFRRALAKLSIGKTVLVIAHRLNTIRSSDTIIVMDKGQVVQTGTHNELIKQQGVYHTLWQAVYSTSQRA